MVVLVLTPLNIESLSYNNTISSYNKMYSLRVIVVSPQHLTLYLSSLYLKNTIFTSNLVVKHG